VLQLGIGLACLAVVAAACGSGNNSGASSGSIGTNSGLGLQIYGENSGGRPQTGHILTMLGTSDVADNLDPNVGYYSLDYLAYRMYERGLYNYPSVHGKTFSVVPDLATAMPTVTDGGLKYAVTIRKGAMWNTSPPRQVSAADEVLGVKRSCNPTDPFGGQPDFNDILAGYSTFCSGFSKVSSTSASAQAGYINSHNISGVAVDPSVTSGLTVDFTLTKPANYFTGVLLLAPFNPVPTEILKYLPHSFQLSQHTYSDGPYEVHSYTPNKSIVFVRNPVWQPRSDPIRTAYVNGIEISETGNEYGIFQQIITNTPQADMGWDAGLPPSVVPSLIASRDPRFQLLTESATDPYIAFNTVSKNEGGALSKLAVRRALMYALSRTQLVQNQGGPLIHPPLTHFVAPGTNGSSPTFDDYPFDPARAKRMFTAAGYGHLTLTLLYRSDQISSAKDFQTIQANLAAVGVTVRSLGVSNADFNDKYLGPGTAAKNSVWDIAEAGWGPDWYPTGGKSDLLPVLSCAAAPPTGANVGFFCDPEADSIMQQALAAPTDSQASILWHKADMEVMSQAAVFPISDPNEATMHGSQVHNCVYVAPFLNCDPTNVWLSA
jgi:peptide/nickel transport system substrate-binding protein